MLWGAAWPLCCFLWSRTEPPRARQECILAHGTLRAGLAGDMEPRLVAALSPQTGSGQVLQPARS